MTLRTDASLVPREPVERQLARLFERSGGEITGPTGSGKTSAVAAWASRTKLADVAWLPLESRHRDSQALSGDLFEILSSEGSTARPAELADLDLSMAVLADGLKRSRRRRVLVLDDVEVLDGAPSLGVLRALRSVQDDVLRMVLVGRWLPRDLFSEDRRRGRLAMCSPADLRLDVHETADIVGAVVGRPVADAVAEVIHGQIEGWALGAALSGLVLRDLDDPEAFADLVVDGHAYFHEAIGAQVFDSLDPEMQRFLLDTCVLETLDPDVCRVVTGRADAEEMLRRLARSNTFTEWIGGPALTFRYHRLLRSWLRRRRDRDEPGHARQQLRDVAAWCAANGRWPEAIDYSIDADDVLGAAEAIVEYGPRALSDGRYAAVAGWIERLPSDHVAGSAPLLILLAESAHRCGQTDLVTVVRALAADLLQSQPPDARTLHVLLAVEVQRCRELSIAGRLNDAGDVALGAVALVDLDAVRPDSQSTPTFDETALALDLSSFSAHLLLAGALDASAELSHWVVDKFPSSDPAVAPARIACLGRLAICELLDRARPAALQHAREAFALWRYHGRSSADVAWAIAPLLVTDTSIENADELHRHLDQLAEQVRIAAPYGLAKLLRAWALARAGDIDTARDLVSSAQTIIESLAQPGMLPALQRRVAAMVATGSDEPQLTRREREVLAALATGAPRRVVAERMHLSVNTVKTYTQSSYRVLGVGTLQAAIEQCEVLGIPLTHSDPTPR